MVTLVLSRSVSVIAGFLQLEMFLLDQIANVGVNPIRYLKLFSRELIFEVFQPTVAQLRSARAVKKILTVMQKKENHEKKT